MTSSQHHHHITIRLATPADADGLKELAELDGGRAPRAPALIGELEGQLVAAVAIGEGSSVANPFVPTAELVDLLRLRARQLDPPPTVRERVLARLPTASGQPVRHTRDRFHRPLKRADVAVQHLD